MHERLTTGLKIGLVVTQTLAMGLLLGVACEPMVTPAPSDVVAPGQAPTAAPEPTGTPASAVPPSKTKAPTVTPKQATTAILPAAPTPTPAPLPTVTATPHPGVTPTPVPSPPSAWSVYQNSLLGYSISAAPGWAVDDTSSRSVSMRNPGEWAASLYIFSSDRTGETLEQFTDGVIDLSRRAAKARFELISRSEVTLPSGIRASRVEFLAQDSSAYCVNHVEEVIALVGSAGYELYGSVCQHALGLLGKDVEAMLNSFKILSASVVASTPTPSPAGASAYRPAATRTPAPATPRPAATPTPTASFAPEAPPHRFYGNAKIGNAFAPDGTTVNAAIDGAVVAATSTTGGRYIVDVVQPAGKSYAGRTVTFTVGGIAATQRAPWFLGEVTSLNLTTR